MSIRQRLVSLAGWSWYFGLLFIAVVVGSAIVTRQLPRVYEARAILEIDVPASADNGQGGTDVAASQEFVRPYSQLVARPEVLLRAADRLNTSLTAEQLGRVVSAQPLPNTQLFTITARGSNPDLARDTANGVAQAFIEQLESWQHQGPATVSLVQPAQSPTQSSLDLAWPVWLILVAGLAATITVVVARIWDRLNESHVAAAPARDRWRRGNVVRARQ